MMKKIALAAALIASASMPALANHHEKGAAGDMKKMSTECGHMCSKHGCMMMLSKDGNNMMMMKDGMMMVGDKKADKMMLMKGGKMMEVKKDSAEGKMMMEHMKEMMGGMGHK